MGTGPQPGFPHMSELYARHSAPHGNGHAGLTSGRRTGSVMRKRMRMRLLHFENAFGDAYASEYCLDAMISLVLTMARSARSDADRLERLAGTAAEAAPVRRAG